jgi:hypothetical protein
LLNSLKMKKFKLIIFLLTMSLGTFAQVGIGTISPVSGALLELKSTDKALLLSRVADAPTAIAAPEDGMLVYDNSLNCFRSRENGVWTPCWNCCATPSTTLGTITALNCAGVVNTGTLTQAVAATAVSSDFSYTGGNGGTFTGQAIASTGVTGLTATLVAGNLATGAGTVTYVISGTPASAGTASFAVSIAGQSCSLTRTIN